MKPKDIREKTVEDLMKQLSELREEAFRLNFKHSIGQLEQTTNLKNTRRNVARINTVLNERKSAK